MKIALAQINSRIGDLRGNMAQILDAVDAAAAQGADLVVTPELALCGYPPRDLLYDGDFVDQVLAAPQVLARQLSHRHARGPALVVGTLARPAAGERAVDAGPRHPGLFDAALLIDGGAVVAGRAKRLLPVYDVFYEPRWFVPGAGEPPIDWRGHRLGLLICEDLWDEDYAIRPAPSLCEAGADLLICLSASPYRQGVARHRRHHAVRAARLGVPLIYVNAVGANDELIFDGGSFALRPDGTTALELPRFAEAVSVVDIATLQREDGRDPTAAHAATADGPPLTATTATAAADGDSAELLAALTLGVRDFCRKNGVRRAFVGLSGGVDSALVLCIAARALGAGAVTALTMPSRYSDPRSAQAAHQLGDALGVRCEEVSIEPLLSAAEAHLQPLLHAAGSAASGATGGDTTFENVQARLRALVLMAYVNRRGGILLNTSNKTELAMGYSTLYGDMAGALGVIADLTKPQVYALCHHINATSLGAAGKAPIPAFVLERPASAELRADQVDPFDYPRDAPLIESLVQHTALPADADAGTRADMARFRRMLRAAEHKRWQFGIVLKVSERAFGTGRMVPVTQAVTRVDG